MMRKIKHLFACLLAVSLLGGMAMLPAQAAQAFSTTPMIVAKGANIVLKADGTVWGWGSNILGQLGDGTTITRNKPVQAKNIDHVIAVDEGDDHTVALKDDGTVWSWGQNDQGQLGDGKGGFIDGGARSNFSTVPVKAVGLDHVIAIAAGPQDTIALKDNGTVWVWGDNYDGQLGNGTGAVFDGTPNNILTPTQVPGFNDVVSVTGCSQTFLVKKDGTLWASGYGVWFIPGATPDKDGLDYDARTTFEQIPNLSDVHVTSVAAATETTLMLTSDKTIWTMGENFDGQRGTPINFLIPIWAMSPGFANISPYPTQTEDLTDVTAVAAGERHSLALTGDGTVWAFGFDEEGQLGDGRYVTDFNIDWNTYRRYTPMPVHNLSNVTAIAASADHNAALKSDGTIWTWGSNAGDALGIGTEGVDDPLRATPVQVLSPNGKGYFNAYESTIPATSVTIAGGVAHNLDVGQTLQLAATVAPGNATYQDVTWSTSNAAVATVTTDGLVKAVGSGTATITATTVDGSYTATVSVTCVKTIFSTKYVSNFLNWLLFIVCFGWIWMWF